MKCTPVKQGVDKGGLLRACGNLLYTFAPFMKIQNDSKIESLFEILKHLHKGCISQELEWRPKTFRLYVCLCLLCGGQADLRIK